MIQIFNDIQKAIADNVPAIRLIDINLGQLQKWDTNPPVAFPCVLITFPEADYRNLGLNQQSATVTVIVDVAFRVWERSSNITPEEFREGTWQHIATVNSIMQAIHGLEGESYNRLVNKSMKLLSDSIDPRTYRLTYQCTIYDNAIGDLPEFTNVTALQLFKSTLINGNLIPGTLTAAYADDADYNDIITAAIPVTNNTATQQTCTVFFKLNGSANFAKYIALIPKGETHTFEHVFESVNIFQQNIITVYNSSYNQLASNTIEAIPELEIEFTPQTDYDTFTLSLAALYEPVTVDWGDGTSDIISEMYTSNITSTLTKVKTYPVGSTYLIRFTNSLQIRVFSLTVLLHQIRTLITIRNLIRLRRVVVFYITDLLGYVQYRYNFERIDSYIKKFRDCNYMEFTAYDYFDDSCVLYPKSLRVLYLRYCTYVNLSESFFQSIGQNLYNFIIQYSTKTNDIINYRDINIPALLNYPNIQQNCILSYCNMPNVDINSHYGNGYNVNFSNSNLLPQAIDNVLNIVATKNNYTGSSSKSLIINGYVYRRTKASDADYTTLISKGWTITAYALNTIHGYLYNYLVVNTGKIAPIGTHIPTLAEYNTLITYLGSYTVAGQKMKQAGTTNWTTPNTGTNTSGYTGVGTGYRSEGGSFQGVGLYNQCWTITESGTQAQRIYLQNTTNSVLTGLVEKRRGLSIRCLLDNPNIWYEGMIVTDYEGNVYNTVQIGTQVWLTQDLISTRYNDGELIAHMPGTSAEWAALTTPAYCSYDNQ